MERTNTALLVVASGVASEFQNLGTKIFENGRKVNRSSGSHTGSELSLTKVTADTTNRELQTSLGRGSR